MVPKKMVSKLFRLFKIPITLLINVLRQLAKVAHLRNKRSMGLDALLDNNDTSSKYMFMYDK